MDTVYILDVDSGERDPTVYPSPNEYTVKLNRPLYNVKEISLISARLPLTQYLINDGNRTFDIHDGSALTTVNLDKGTWASGDSLSSNLTDQLTNYNETGDDIDVTYCSNLQSFTFTHSDPTATLSFNFYGGDSGYATGSATGTPASVLGFDGSNVASVSNVLTSNVIDLSGPQSLVLSLSSGSDQFNTDVFVNGGTFSFDSMQFNDTNAKALQSTYIGRILTNGPIGSVMNYKCKDDPVKYAFWKGPEKQIDEFTIRFYYNNGTKLVPYDFNSRNHILKFEIRCSLDKFNNLESEDKSIPLPPPVELNSKPRYTKQQRTVYIIIGIALVVGLVLLALFKQ